MRRSGYLARQQRLLRLLDERRELSAEYAAAELGCSRRTIYRDFLVLSETGVPIYPEAEGRRVCWRLVDGPKRRLSITLSFSEMLALTAGRDLLAGLTGTFFHEAAITALEKIRAALPDPLLARADATADLVLAEKRPARDYRGRGEAVRALVDAIDRHETVGLKYRKLSERKAKQRLVDPYHLHLHSGALYLIAWCHERQAARTFLLDRASRVEPTGHDIDLACRTCPLEPTCAYPQTFEPRPPADATRLSNLQDVPRPFVFDLPLDESPDFPAGVPVTFGLTAVGRAARLVPYFVSAFRTLADEGLGPRRAKFDLISVAAIDARGAATAI